MTAHDTDDALDTPALDYYPAPESQGGWRWLRTPDEVRDRAGLDPARLERIVDLLDRFDDTSGLVIIRHGYLAAEWYDHSALATTRYDIWSCVKSFTGTAYGLLFDDCRQGKLPLGRAIDLDTPAYRFIPEGHPLTDPRKARITFRHLLSMTSGIPGERHGIAAIPTETGVGPFEAALGLAPTRARRWPAGRWTSTLATDPGTAWDYSDPAMAHLALAFFHVTDREIHEVMAERVFAPIGIEHLSWDLQGVGAGFIGPHTNAHTGIHVSARELARFGYLMLRGGRWRGEQLVPAWWGALATRSSQPLNPHYGFTWWVNSTGTRWPGLPTDAFAASGYRSNRCYVVPSLDLVVARTGSGPAYWDEQALIGLVVDAILPA
jgi:CubicO group peptidase (beta-lactamase class C family)